MAGPRERKGKHVRRIVKYLLIFAAGLVCLVILALAWSIYAGQERYGAAKNDCERACIGDSGGLDQCRVYCVTHPNRYP